MTPQLTAHTTKTAIPSWPWNSTVSTDFDIYTGFIPSLLMTNTRGCCYSL